MFPQAKHCPRDCCPADRRFRGLHFGIQDTMSSGCKLCFFELGISMFLGWALSLDSGNQMLLLKRLWAGVCLARPLNCGMSALAVFLGASTVTRNVPGSVLICGMVCAALITAGGNSLNDFFDAESDRLNHPRRAIPSGRISRKAALYIAFVEIAIGTASGLWINIWCGLIATLAIALLAVYEVAGAKNAGLPGNITISLLTGLLFLLGGALASDPIRPAGLAVPAFVASLGREIIKDMEDMHGDTSRRTWPKRVGWYRARIGAALLLGSAVALSPIPYLLGILSFWYLPVVLLADLAFLAAILFLFYSIGKVSGTAKLAMATVLVAMVAGIWK
jgi:geranylgeranylglycerol-phosphate geranylgeranyltransferase